MRITRDKLYVGLTYIWAVFVIVGWRKFNNLQILNIAGFLALMFIPGLLTHLSMRRSRQKLPFWHQFGQVIGWSILEVLLCVLFFNTVLPHLHVPRPLDRHPLLIELSALYAGIAIWSWPRLKRFSYRPLPVRWRPLLLDFAVGIVPVLFVALSVLGALSLNNGGTNLFTLFMLIGMGGYMVLLYCLRNRLRDNTFAWAIYMMGLSLLLMTSLRSWYITGHDIEREYRVFQITKQNGVWNIAAFRDPYYACLSITILPTVIANLLVVPDPYIYKVYFQLFFAVVPVLVFLFMRRYLSRSKAFLAAVYFIAFPTFFTDMSMLNRQEIAFLFLILMLLVVLEKRMARHYRQRLFMAFGIGLVLTHYSTTYSAIFILILVVCSRPVFWWLVARYKNLRIFRQTNISLPLRRTARSVPNITLLMVAGLAIAAVLWNSVLTNTSTAGSVLRTTISSITKGLNEDSRSNDVSYSLLSGGNADPSQQLKAFQKLKVEPARVNAAKDTYYPASVVNRYPLQVVPESVQPLTEIGRLLDRAHVNVQSLNYDLKQTSAKLLQLFVAIGLVYTLFRRKLSRQLEPDFMLLSVACVVFLAIQIALPYLSVAYGLLRAFQQSLMVIGLFLVVGTYVLTMRFKNPWLKHGVPLALAVVFFLSSTGVISQMLGGYQELLHLDNGGQYYDTYYMHKQEVVADYWLAGALKQPDGQADVQTDLFTANRFGSLTNIDAGEDMTPGIVEQHSYVIVGYTATTKDQVTVDFSGNLITYKYPKQFLNQNKNLIYNDGGTEIYK